MCKSSESNFLFTRFPASYVVCRKGQHDLLQRRRVFRNGEKRHYGGARFVGRFHAASNRALPCIEKQQAVRTIILVILAVALMLAPVAGLDIRNEKELDKIRTEYSDKGVKVENYSLQKQWFNALSANKRESGYAYKLNERVDNVIRTYGLSEYYPKMYRERTQLNTAVAYYQVGGLDGEMIKVTGDNIDGLFDSLQSQSPYAYNPNGLLYDGYIFGVENALELLIKYNEYAKLTVYRPTKYTVADYAEAFNAGCYVIKDGAYVTMKAAGETFSKQPGTIYYESLSIADAYKKMVSEIEESATNASAYESDAWYNYTNDITEILDTRTGKMTNYSTLRIEEDNYRLTDSRLNAVLGTLFEYLGMNPAINKLLDSLKAQQLLDLVNSLLKENGADLSSGDIGNVVSQLLYGYNNGKGGETTGLALPAQYLFGNLNFTSKEVYKSTGKNAFKVGARRTKSYTSPRTKTPAKSTMTAPPFLPQRLPANRSTRQR